MEPGAGSVNRSGFALRARKEIDRAKIPLTSALSWRLATSRIEQLQELLAHDPSSAFARYGLAMAYVQQGELEQAISEFEALVGRDPGYAAAYFHGGQTYEKLGRLDEARDYYRRGIAVVRDPHARGELQAALDILGD